jgi:molybdenum cofactor cytidylyltransferase
MAVAAILLAAGAPGETGLPAALWLWDEGATLIEFQIAQLQTAGIGAIEVVLGDQAERIIPMVAGGEVEPIVNPRWRDGAPSSIRAGASAVPRGTDAAIIVDVTQPRPAEVYRRLLDEHQTHDAAITRPSFEGTPGSPIVVNEAILSEARNLTDSNGLQALLDRHAREILNVPSERGVVLLTVRSAEDCAQVRSAFDLA